LNKYVIEIIAPWRHWLPIPVRIRFSKIASYDEVYEFFEAMDTTYKIIGVVRADGIHPIRRVGRDRWAISRKWIPF
jgi:hypothetical protein